MACDPATVGSAPVHIIGLDIKDVLGGQGSPHHVAPCGVLHPLGLPGRPASVKLHSHMHGINDVCRQPGKPASWFMSKNILRM